MPLIDGMVRKIWTLVVSDCMWDQKIDFIFIAKSIVLKHFRLNNSRWYYLICQIPLCVRIAKREILSCVYQNWYITFMDIKIQFIKLVTWLVLTWFSDLLSDREACLPWWRQSNSYFSWATRRKLLYHDFQSRNVFFSSTIALTYYSLNLFVSLLTAPHRDQYHSHGPHTALWPVHKDCAERA